MRVLNVTETYAPFYEFGGPPAKVEALSRGLVARGNEVTVLTADWGIENRTARTDKTSVFSRSEFGREGEDRGVRAVYLPTWFKYRATSWNPAAKTFLRENLAKFDVAHIFGLYDLLGPAVARACRSRNIPYVVEPIGMFVPIVRNVWMKRLYHAWLGQQMLDGAARVIATSEQELQELTGGGIPAEKVSLRRNGVVAPERLPDRGVFRAAKEIPADALLVLFLGRLSEKKSPALLLKSFSALPSKIGGKVLHLVYAGPDEQEMQTKLTEMSRALQVSERVHFTGPVFHEEKWAAYQDADVFVLPSLNENFGNTAAESAAVGTPVIVTENCGIAPLLAEGAIVIRHNEAELTEALRKLSGNEALRMELGRRARLAAAEIGWDEPVRETESLYRKLAEKQ